MRTRADVFFVDLLKQLLAQKPVTTRNAECRKVFAPPSTQFSSLPLVTVRPVATKLAMEELRWYVSGRDECPENLRHWWADQLAPDGTYRKGYPEQLRRAGGVDQLGLLIDGIRASPHGRRHVVVTWRADDAVKTVKANKNPKTPTPCHLSYAQFSVSPCGKRLHMLSVQRSADVLLGLIHNLVQHWALLVFVAHHTGLKVGWMTWQGADIHLYNEPSHIACATEIVQAWNKLPRSERLGSRWKPTLNTNFDKPGDGLFQVPGPAAADSFDPRHFIFPLAPKPLSTIRPALL